MPTIHIICESEGCWSDLPELEREGKLIELMHKNAPEIHLALLPGGLESGAASVGIRIDLPDVGALVTETSFALLENAVMAFKGYLDGKALREGRGPSILDPEEPEREIFEI